MIIILGSTGKHEFVDIIKKNGWGRMLTPQKHFKPFESERYAVDNGAFYFWKRGEKFKEYYFLKTIEFSCKYHEPYFAVLPDIVTGGNISLDFSLSWINRLPRWPWYLAVQDGMDSKLVIEHIHSFSGLFLGGSDDFKKTASYWRKIAHIHKKKFHYGRAGTYSKLQHAYDSGADSLDSAFPLWTTKRFKEFVLWTKTKPWENRLFSLKELDQGY